MAFQDSLLQTVLANYSLATPGVLHALNSTVRLGLDDVPQPDGYLRIKEECGGQARIDSKGHLAGAPELVVEVAASSASIDARDKRTSYRRAGAREYILWRTEDDRVDWSRLEDDQYVSILPDADGISRSRIFPGLWLDVKSLIARDGAAVMRVLQQGLVSPEHATFVEKLNAAKCS